jgi:hypothetical protein
VGAYCTVALEVPQRGQVHPRPAGAERVEYLTRERPDVEPVGVAGVGVGPPVFEAQRRRAVETGRRDDGGRAAEPWESLGDGVGEPARRGGVGAVDGDP